MVVLAFFFAVARLTRIGRLDRKWPFISVRALSRSFSRLRQGMTSGRVERTREAPGWQQQTTCRQQLEDIYPTQQQNRKGCGTTGPSIHLNRTKP